MGKSIFNHKMEQTFKKTNFPSQQKHLGHFPSVLRLLLSQPTQQAQPRGDDTGKNKSKEFLFHVPLKFPASFENPRPARPATSPPRLWPSPPLPPPTTHPPAPPSADTQRRKSTEEEEEEEWIAPMEEGGGGEGRS